MYLELVVIGSYCLFLFLDLTACFDCCGRESKLSCSKTTNDNPAAGVAKFGGQWNAADAPPHGEDLSGSARPVRGVLLSEVHVCFLSFLCLRVSCCVVRVLRWCLRRAGLRTASWWPSQPLSSSTGLWPTGGKSIMRYIYYTQYAVTKWQPDDTHLLISKCVI